MKRVKFHNSLLHNLRTVLWPNTVKWAPKGTQALRTPSGNEIYQIKAKSKSDLSDEVGNECRAISTNLSWRRNNYFYITYYYYVYITLVKNDSEFVYILYTLSWGRNDFESTLSWGRND